MFRVALSHYKWLSTDGSFEAAAEVFLSSYQLISCSERNLWDKDFKQLHWTGIEFLQESTSNIEHDIQYIESLVAWYS